MKNADYFNVESIIIDPSLQFINKRDLIRLKGKNIFSVDLKAVQDNINARYPQISDLKVTRRFPNQIQLQAKKRVPFAQMKFKNGILVLDERGVVLSTGTKEDSQLPFIVGFNQNLRYSLGLPLTYSSIKVALEILRAMQAYGGQTPYEILKVDIDNLSKINIYLSKDLVAIVDSDKVDRKIKILNLILSQGQVDLGTVQYIDLRFKEPIIGKK